LTRFVIDCSVTMAWCFENQADAYTKGVLGRLGVSEASVPSIWAFEVANSLAVGERRKKLTKAATNRFLGILAELPIIIDEQAHHRALDRTLSLAREQTLSGYDAAYLELAMREGLPLATRDGQLKKAARVVGVPLVPA
jgi:predicted nucleic acid-binding protein